MSYKIMQQLIEQLKFYAIEKLTSDTQNLLELYLIQKNVADSLSDAKTQYALDSNVYAVSICHKISHQDCHDLSSKIA